MKRYVKRFAGRPAGGLIKSFVKGAALLAVIVLCLSLVGCDAVADTDERVFQYRDKLTSASADVGLQGRSYRVKWTLEGERRIEILSPEGVAGCAFVKDGDNVFAVYGEMKIPLSGEFSSGLLPFFEMFDLSETDINSISKTDDGKTEVSAKGKNGIFSVVLSSDGMPEKFSYTGERSFEVTGFEFETKESAAAPQ